MSWLPPAVTFEDGQRKLYGWLMAGAGFAYSVAVLVGVWYIVDGGWPASLDKDRLYILAYVVGGGVLGSIAVTLALAVGGPVGRFSVSAGKNGLDLAAEERGRPPAVTTTTETRVSPPPENEK